MSLFKTNIKYANVETTSYISLKPYEEDDGTLLYFAFHKWHTYINVHHIQHMLFYIGKANKDGIPEYYEFSPYTLDGFLLFIAKAIENETIIPRTHGKKFTGTKVNVTFYENVWKKDKNGKVMVHKGHPVLYTSEVQASFPDVPLTDKYEHVTLFAFYLLFCSYSEQKIDSFKDLKGQYKSLRTIAKEFGNQYEVEYRNAQNKSIDRKHMATIPSYEQFADRNHDAVYIPALATKEQIAIANAPHQDQDKNMMYLSKTPVKDKNEFKLAKISRKNKEIDQEVNEKENPKLKARNRILREKEDKTRQKEREELKKERHQIALEHQENNSTSSSSSNSSNNSSSNKSTQSNKASSSVNSITTSTKSKSDYRKNKSGSSSKASEPSSASAKNPAVQSSKESNTQKSNSSSNNNSKGKNTNHQNNRNSTSKSLSKSTNTANVPSNRKLWNIDYSSSKQPYVLTNDKSTLTQAIKSYYHLRNTHNFIHFNSSDFFNIKQLPSLPKKPQSLLKDGKIGIQYYVSVEENNYKQLANSILKHEEKILNLALNRHENNLIRESSFMLNRKVPLILDKYRNNNSVKHSAFNYFKKVYYGMVNQLQEERNRRVRNIKLAIRRNAQSRLQNALSNLDAQLSNQRRHMERNISNHTVYVYNDSRSRRNRELNKTLRETKSQVHKALQENINNHRTEVLYRANKVGHMLSDMFYHKLQDNKRQWVKTATQIVQLQTKKVDAQAKLRKIRLETQKANISGQLRHNKALRSEVERLRQYTDDVDKKSDLLQDKLSKMQTKSLENLDNNTQLHTQIDNLKASQEESRNRFKLELQESENEVARLKDELSNRKASSSKLTNENNSIVQARAKLQSQLVQAHNNLHLAQKQSLNHQKEVAHMQEIAQKSQLKAAALQQSLEDVKQSYSTMSLIANNNDNSSYSSQLSSLSASQSTATSITQSKIDSYSNRAESQSANYQKSLSSVNASLSVEKANTSNKASVLSSEISVQNSKAQLSASTQNVKHSLSLQSLYNKSSINTSLASQTSSLDNTQQSLSRAIKPSTEDSEINSLKAELKSNKAQQSIKESSVAESHRQATKEMSDAKAVASSIKAMQQSEASLYNLAKKSRNTINSTKSISHTNSSLSNSSNKSMKVISPSDSLTTPSMDAMKGLSLMSSEDAINSLRNELKLRENSMNYTHPKHKLPWQK